MKLTSLLVLNSLLFTSLLHAASSVSFNVRDFGATGDGKIKDTAAFQKALDACAAAGGGRVVVPAGYYLLGSVVLGSKTTLQLENRANLIGSPDIKDYPLVRVRWEGEFHEGHRALISAETAGDVGIVGRGFIYGPPVNVSCLRNPRGPALIELTSCTNVTLEGFSTQYQQLWSIHPLLCQKVVARDLTIRSLNFNGDGMDVDSCQDVLIERCNIDTGDDAIALKSGRGMEAVRLARPTQDVTIRDCSLVSSIFAGLAIGTELSGGIRNIRIENCFISGRQNGLFFKSRDGRGGYIENFTGDHLVINDAGTFVGMDLVRKGIPASEPVPGDIAKWTEVRNIRFSHIQVNHVGHLVLAQNIPAARPVDGFSLSDITGTCGHGLTLANMTNVVLEGINVSGYRGPLLTKTNVHGQGLEITQ